MARGVNKVILVGNLGADPEVRYMPNGNAVANVTLATTDSWNDKATGQKQERTEWHRVVFFGKLAEIVGQYVKKGSQIYIEGRLQTRKWQDTASGQDRYTTEIVVDQGGQMQMLGGASQGGQPAQQGGYQQPQAAPQAAPQYQQAAPQQQQGGFQPQAQPKPQAQVQQPYQQPAPQQGGYQQPPQAAPQPGAGAFDSFDDDIPF